jgi:hypothetical protein
MTFDNRLLPRPCSVRGLVIFAAATLYMLAFAVYVCAKSSSPWGFMTYVGATIALLAYLVVCGFSWARVVMSVVACLTGCVLLLRALTLIVEFGDMYFYENLLISFVLLVLPATGYLVCSGLLCLPSVRLFADTIWQRPDQLPQSDDNAAD